MRFAISDDNTASNVEVTASVSENQTAVSSHFVVLKFRSNSIKNTIFQKPLCLRESDEAVPTAVR
jgi:hypothetical protein